MAHDHASVTAGHRGRLFIVLTLTAGFMVVEAIAGLLTNSLVLIADAGHMLTDVAGLSIALTAIWLAQRPATQTKTYGYYRAEILGALLNSVLLFAVSAYILFEAYRRFQDPPNVPSAPLLVVATLGLGVNILGASLLMRGASESLNTRGAFLEVLGDLLGSVGAIAAGIVLLTTGWRYADPLFAAAVGLLILPRTWLLLKGALDILFEGTPSHISLADVQQTILSTPGVDSVHDLHIWAVTSGFVALSGHVQVSERADRDRALLALRERLREGFDIDHVTIQIEHEELESQLEQPCLPGQTACYADNLVQLTPSPRKRAR